MGTHLSQETNSDTDLLFQVIADLTTAEEARNFFEDLCTIKEIRDMGQRLQAAILLDKGYSYQDVTEAVGISSATISRVSKSLYYGAGGYRAVIDKLQAEK